MRDPQILLVEDSPDDVLLARRAFRIAGVSARLSAVESGEQAVAYLSGTDAYGDRERYPMPDLVMLDVNLPGLSGFDVLEWIRGRPEFGSLPVLMLTARADRADIDRAGLIGATSYIVKPLTPDAIWYLVDPLTFSMDPPLRVLFIDDNPDDRALALRRLRTEFPHIEALQAGNADEVGKALDASAFDLVITDYHVPGTSGLDVLRRVKARRPDCPVIMLTGTGSEAIAAEAMKAGLDDYVLKAPHHLARLPAAVRLAVGRVLQRRALRESERRYRMLFDRNLAGVFRASLGGRILECNPAFAKMYGYDSPSDLVACPATGLYAEPRDRDELIDLLRQQSHVLNYEVRGRRKDGKDVAVLENVSLIHPEEGEPVLEGTVIDITDHKRLQGEFMQAQKMEAVGRLAGGVAHDINNILTAIHGHSYMLSTLIGGDHPALDDVLQIQKAVERAASLTRQLLAFSRKQILVPQTLDLNAAVAEIERMLRRVIGEDIELVLQRQPGLGHVRADPGQLDQVVLNLAVNARDAMPKGGRLTIGTSETAIGDAVAGQFDRIVAGPYVVLSVSDTGTGMGTETMSHLFEPFFTTKEKGKGTGLGLATVYGIVKQSGGYVRVRSEVGLGTTIEVYLPRVEGQVEPAPQPAPDGGTRRCVETILLVEDEPHLREVAMRALEQSGYTVLEAASPDAAVELAARYRNDIHLLLTDVVMPGMSGVDVADAVKGLRPGVKTLFMSGYTDEVVARHLIVEAGVAFLEKPFTAAALRQKLREILDASAE